MQECSKVYDVIRWLQNRGYWVDDEELDFGWVLIHASNEEESIVMQFDHNGELMFGEVYLTEEMSYLQIDKEKLNHVMTCDEGSLVECSHLGGGE